MSCLGFLYVPEHVRGIHVLDRYSLLFASRGANVVVNDVSQAAAQKVVDEITKGVWPTASGKITSNEINMPRL